MSDINIFTNEADESPVQVIRQTMSVSLDDNGEAQVSFATNKGKGSGAQTIPVGDFAEVVSTLQEFAASGFEGKEEENISPAETIRRTIRLEDGVVSFRTRSGKGSKPAKIPLDQFTAVCELLGQTVEPVIGAGVKLG